MKSLNGKLTKLIVILLVTAFTLMLFSCGQEEIEESSVVEEVSHAPVLSVETAVSLIERDRLITEIFVCNSLCDPSNTEAVRTTVAADSEYASYSAIEALMNSTYTKESGDKNFFIEYPHNQEPSVINFEGKTSVFCHSGSTYTDFADTVTVSVSDTDKEDVKTIYALTVSGKEVCMNAVYQNGRWLLEKGIYRTNPPESVSFDTHFAESGIGSFSDLKGNILVIELFISDEETSFTAAEESAFHQKIKSAADRIALDAANYGTSTNFDYVSAYFEHDSVLGTRVLDFDIMFAETGFGTLQAFAESNYALSEYDNFFFAVCIDKSIETSVGVYDNTADTAFYYAERVLLGPSTTEQDIYRSVYQMLGVYGYNEGVLDEYIESLYQFYFPNDCMSVSDMSLSVMSPVTAYTCGLTDELDSLYRIFIPNN